MKNPAALHQAVFELLDSRRTENPEFRFTLRQINRGSRLEKGFWFHGNEHYLAVSFWSGFDWKNKTPDIIFVITQFACYLEIPALAGGEKKRFLEAQIVPKIQGMGRARARFMKFYADGPEQIKSESYKQHLHYFLENEYPTIDGIIKEHEEELQGHLNPIGVITLEKFRKLLDRRAYWESYIRDREEEELKGMPFGLIEILLENYVRITSCKIGPVPPETQCIFLTGENSTGKSTILRGIALALSRDKINGESIALRANLKYIRNGNIHSTEIDFEGDGPSNELTPLISDQGYAAYGPFRLDMEMGTPEKQGMDNPNVSLFQYGIPLLNFSNTIKTIIDPLSSDEQFTLLKTSYLKAVQALLPRVGGIVSPWARDPFPAYLMAKSEDSDETETISYRDLATGAKNILGLLGDLMARLLRTQPKVKELAELSGIVLIDEIDLHLHPKFQRRLVGDLTATFPNVQFIMTTHSPIPLLGAPENSEFFVVRFDTENGIEVEHLERLKVRELTPNTILTSPIFGMDTILHTHFDPEEGELNVYSDEFEMIRTEFSYPELKGNDQLLDSLLDKYKKRTGGNND
jgi:hypothetical protein